MDLKAEQLMERLNEVYKHEHLYDSSSHNYKLPDGHKLVGRNFSKLEIGECMAYATWVRRVLRRQNEAVLRVIKGILQRVLPL